MKESKKANLSQPAHAQQPAQPLSKELAASFFQVIIKHQFNKQVKLIAKTEEKHGSPIKNWTGGDFALDILDHLIEEVIELKQELPRKWWKDERDLAKKLLDVDSKERSRMLAEYADVFIHYINFAVYMDISALELVNALSSKLEYNEKRPDQATSITSEASEASEAI